MGQRLRVVAEMFAGPGVHLLGVQAQRAGAIRQFGEQVEGLAAAVIKRQRVNQPEGTRQERALRARQPTFVERAANLYRNTIHLVSWPGSPGETTEDVITCSPTPWTTSRRQSR